MTYVIESEAAEELMVDYLEEVAEDTWQPPSPSSNLIVALKTAQGMIRKYTETNGTRVLDFGARDCWLARLCLEYGWAYEARENSPQLSDRARRIYPDLRIECGSLHNPDLLPDTYAGIVSIEALQSVPKNDLVFVLKHLHLALKTNGTLVLSLPQKERVEEGFQTLRGGSAPVWLATYEIDELRRIMIRAGLRVRLMFPDQLGPYLYMVATKEPFRITTQPPKMLM